MFHSRAGRSSILLAFLLLNLAGCSAEMKARGWDELDILLVTFTPLAVLALFGPAIASILARGAIEDAVNPTITGSVRVDDVSLSWGGPQTIDGVEILDERGASLATFDASAGAGLFALITGDRNLGELTVTRTNSETLDRDTLDRLAVALASTAPPSGEPMRLPTGLATEATIDLGTLTLEGAVVNDVRAVATLAQTGTVSAVLSTRPNTSTADLRLALAAPPLLPADGLVDLSASGLTVETSGAVPAELLASLLAVDTDRAGTLAINIKLVTRDGALVAENNDDVRAMGVIPSALLHTDDGARFDNAPAFTINAAELSIPLPTDGFAPDPAQITAQLTLDADPITGSVDDGSGGRLAFATDRIAGGVQYDPERGRAILEGGAALRIDGQPSGTIELDALAEGLLDDAGAIRAGGPESLIAEASVLGVPGALVASVHPSLADARAVVGDSINASAEIGITADARTLNNADVSPGQLTVRLLIEGERGTFDAYAFYDGARALRTIGDPGIVATTKGAGLLAQRLLGDDAPVTLASDANADVRISDATIALTPGGALDTTGLAGRATFDIAGLREAGVQDAASSRVCGGATLVSGDLAWTLDARLEDATAIGEGTVASTLGDAPVPAGSLTLANIPTSYAAFVSSGARDALASAFGERLAGTFRTDNATSGTLSLRLSGDLGSVEGQIQIADGLARVPASTPILYTSRNPSALVRTFVAEAAGLPLDLTSGALSLHIDEATIDLNADRTNAPLAGKSQIEGSVFLAKRWGGMHGGYSSMNETVQVSLGHRRGERRARTPWRLTPRRARTSAHRAPR